MSSAGTAFGKYVFTIPNGPPHLPGGSKPQHAGAGNHEQGECTEAGSLFVTSASRPARRPASTRIWPRAAALALLCGGLIALIASYGFHGFLIDMVRAAERVISRHAVLGAVLFTGLAAASAMFAAVSSAVVVPVAVVAWGNPVSLLLLWLGWCLGGMLSYYIGRLPGRTAARWLKADAALHRLEGHLRPDTPFGVILTLQLALPSEIQGYLLGLVRYPLARYLFGLALAELPYAVATIYMSAGLVERRAVLILIPGLAVTAVAVAALLLTRRRMSIAASTDAPARAASENASQG
jgi:uncharacterized membrane protein YdjX (TVP38/TMEM64 family)